MTLQTILMIVVSSYELTLNGVGDLLELQGANSVQSPFIETHMVLVTSPDGRLIRPSL